MISFLFRQAKLLIILAYVIFTNIIYCVVCPMPSQAMLTELPDHEMESVYAATGVSYGIKDVQLFHVIDLLQYTPDNGDGDYLHFQLYTHDGFGGPAKFNFDFGTTMTTSGIITMDVSTDQVAPMDDWNLSTGPSDFDPMLKVIQHIHCADWDQNLAYKLIDFTFSDGTSSYNLGEFDIGPVNLNSFSYLLAPHPGDGIDFEYSFQSNIDFLSYAYVVDHSNFANYKRLTFKNIQFGNSFDFGSSGDDPSDPTTWKTDIGEFRIGNMYGDLTSTDPKNWQSRPAQVDVGMTDRWDNGTYYGGLRLRLPMEGSIRFEQADFAGTDFGPGAIDGINVYRMDVYLVP